MNYSLISWFYIISLTLGILQYCNLCYAPLPRYIFALYTNVAYHYRQLGVASYNGITKLLKGRMSCTSPFRIH